MRELNPVQLEVLRGYSRNGLHFKLIEPRDVEDVKEGSAVHMELAEAQGSSMSEDRWIELGVWRTSSSL
jgi:hypothetical protein